MKIKVHTEQNAENNAMLQALYSRSASSVDEHLEVLKAKGSSNFMSSYYVGYGHKSIGDCGFATVYLEGVSMLAAKAIQDYPLYNGQESSSRYIDWSKQPFRLATWFELGKDRRGEAAQQEVLSDLRKFYVESKEDLVNHLYRIYPVKEGENLATYKKAINAKAFDILRGFLPAGATTNVAWTTNLRNFDEHLKHLGYHPLVEVVEIAVKTNRELANTYPSSFKSLLTDFPKRITDPSNYYWTSGRFYKEVADASSSLHNTESGAVRSLSSRVLELKKDTLPDFPLRTWGERIPRYYFLPEQYANLIIDFGSFRDLHRHRNGKLAMPILTPNYHFNAWYLEQLPPPLYVKALNLLAKVERVYGKLRKEFTPEVLQYMLPMGYNVATTLQCSVDQMLYIAELRSGQTVHATLRPIAQAIGKNLVERGLKTVFYDDSPDEWTTRRGTQDITPL